mmetsp:Transcript_87987/g.138929  ORF Transcript_87987/g.138929 Transcript_87987/m.138929 type:complete len:202 (-) Transcript_87987:103-708(-)
MRRVSLSLWCVACSVLGCQAGTKYRSFLVEESLPATVADARLRSSKHALASVLFAQHLNRYRISQNVRSGGSAMQDEQQDHRQLTTEEDIKQEKALKAMVGFSNSYLKKTGTKLCDDESVAAVVIKGLAEHKVTLGAPLCPCRHYEDKKAEAKDGYWNCPCVPMRERHECHCMLFMTEDNEFAGDCQRIELDEVKTFLADY